MNKSKILRAVLAAVLLLVATAASAHDFEFDGIYYKYNGDGTVSVSYRGDTYYDYANEYTGDVTIPSSITYSGKTYSVTSIGDEAFLSCSGLKSVTIPNSVTSIGSKAFEFCSGLTRVDISSIEAWLGIKFVGFRSNPLSYARHLYLNGEEVKDLVIPNSVTSIGDWAFNSCKGLTSVTIPNSITSIGNYAFSYCSGL